jgi:hypothetical protein
LKARRYESTTMQPMPLSASLPKSILHNVGFLVQP